MLNIEGKIYCCILPEVFPKGTEALLLGGLPDYRREKAEKYLHSRDRFLSAAVWHLLRYAVYEVSGLDAFKLPISTDSLRKPFFESVSGTHFNVSHCRMAVVCAVDSRPCGVDIEPLRTADAEIIRRVMPDCLNELARMTGQNERDDFFTRSWTDAESVYKSGMGSACGVFAPDNYGLYRFRRDVYYISLCAMLRHAEFKLTTVSFNELISHIQRYQ